VVFVPYDFSEAQQSFSLSVPANTNDVEFKKLLFEKVGRECEVLVGNKQYSTSWAWGMKLEKDRAHVVFEVPDLSGLYLRCVVKINSGYTQEVSGTFLVRVENVDATKEDVMEAVEQKLAKVWEVAEDVTEGLDEDRMKIVKARKPPNASVFASNEDAKVSLTLGTVMQTSQSWKLSVTASNKNVLENQCSVVMNPKFPRDFVVLMKNWSPSYPTAAAKTQKASDSVNLLDCFSFYSEPEILDDENKWKCPHCNAMVCATKTLDIWKVPDVLVIELKRFMGGGRYSYGAMRKLDTLVDFPDEISTKDFVVGPQKDEDIKYRLYAVSNHSGGLGGGHYTAHVMVQNPFKGPDPNGKWYYFNDSSVSSCSAKSAHGSSAYVLFYEMVEKEEDPMLDVD
jgi:ubiquitin carboxyl-terminal hydrolase 4/11/15